MKTPKPFSVPEAIEELHRAYKQLIKKKDKSYVYKGPLLTSNDILVCCPNIDVTLSYEEFIYRVQEKGVHPMEHFIQACIQLGIEQGIRIANK